MAGFHVRVISAGGSVTLPPCRLSAVGPNGFITDAWGRTFGAPVSAGADWGAGTAPFIHGTVVATRDTVAWFNFSV